MAKNNEFSARVLITNLIEEDYYHVPFTGMLTAALLMASTEDLVAFADFFNEVGKAHYGFDIEKSEPKDHFVFCKNFTWKDCEEYYVEQN